MRNLTLCLAYYINPSMLKVYYDHLAAMPDEIRKHMAMIVVDDCSPTGPAYPPLETFDIPTEIYRMRVDIPWAQDACRNLAVDKAKTEWVLLTDMDHMPTKELLTFLIYDHTKTIKEQNAYKFQRVSAPDMSPYKPHPNSWFMTKAMYDMIGGYDERCCGVYGTDGAFSRGVQAHANKIVEIPEALIRVPREVIPDASTTTLVRRSEENDRKKTIIGKEISLSNNKRPVRFMFEWDRVY